MCSYVHECSLYWDAERPLDGVVEEEDDGRRRVQRDAERRLGRAVGPRLVRLSPPRRAGWSTAGPARVRPASGPRVDEVERRREQRGQRTGERAGERGGGGGRQARRARARCSRRSQMERIVGDFGSVDAVPRRARGARRAQRAQRRVVAGHLQLDAVLQALEGHADRRRRDGAAHPSNSREPAGRPLRLRAQSQKAEWNTAAYGAAPASVSPRPRTDFASAAAWSRWHLATSSRSPASGKAT